MTRSSRSSRRRSPAEEPLYYTGLGDAFVIKLKIALVVGVILAMPVILWHVWRFIAPGLTWRGARLRGLAPAGLAVLRHRDRDRLRDPAVRRPGFLIGFSTADLQPLITAGAYFDFVTTMFLAFGLIMEFPILLFGLSRGQDRDLEATVRPRAARDLGIAIFATAITPRRGPCSPRSGVIDVRAVRGNHLRHPAQREVSPAREGGMTDGARPSQ